jgi:molybdate transport repressor ModE-like protein
MNNWGRFRYYLEVARQGSVSAASKSLGVSHPTILRQIDALEDDLGVKLFKRLQSGFQLSEEGEALLEKTALMQSAVNDIEQSIQKKLTNWPAC